MLRDHRLAGIAKQIAETETDSITVDVSDVAYLLDMIYLQQETIRELEFRETEIDDEEDDNDTDEYGECLRCNGLGCVHCEGD
jgi:hypothetical protein